MSGKVRTVALSASSARSCETAATPQCRCRCNGALHGAARGPISGLPVTDPHSPSSTCPVCKGTGKREQIDYGQWKSGEAPPMRVVDCYKCKGQGRFIKLAIARALRKQEMEGTV